MIRKEDVFCIGKIAKPHGLRGEVRFMFTNDAWDTAECEYLICDVDGILVPFYIEEYRFKSDSVAFVKFEDIDSVDAVQFLVGCDVFMERKDITESDEDEVPLSYFIGYKVVNAEDNKLIGEITDIDDNTENWLFIIEKEDGSEVMIPAHEDFISEIRQEENLLMVDLPEGLI